VDDRHRERCEQVAAALTGVRAAVDGDGTVVERVERAREEWVPWYAVVGDDDAGGPLPVTCPDGRERRLTAPELAVRVPETPTRAWLYPGR
jgi:threonyl-tRNA synthetase